jgi:hypothetical protein
MFLLQQLTANGPLKKIPRISLNSNIHYHDHQPYARYKNEPIQLNPQHHTQFLDDQF